VHSLRPVTVTLLRRQSFSPITHTSLRRSAPPKMKLSR
jgi:hypothetical protein